MKKSLVVKSEQEAQYVIHCLESVGMLVKQCNEGPLFVEGREGEWNRYNHYEEIESGTDSLKMSDFLAYIEKFEKYSPCPFCGSMEITTQKVYHSTGSDYAVKCTSCTAQGPKSVGEEGAVEGWNKRSGKEGE